jgi:hypothetical protein
LRFLTLISRDFKVTERLALAMPIGLGLTSFVMFFLDRTVHSITSGSVMVSAGVLMVFSLQADWRWTPEIMTYPGSALVLRWTSVGSHWFGWFLQV